MDWALITAVTIPFGLTATALWVTYRISRKRKGEKRELGYRRIWSLQGIGVLPGSFMSGQIRWAVCGGTAVVAGVSLLVSARQRGD